MKKGFVIAGLAIITVIFIAGCGEKMTSDKGNLSEAEESKASSAGSVKESRDSHTHSHNERAASGIFDDSEVEDRSLTDWEGQWQSVYPYLEAGKLNQVFEDKAKENVEKTAEEYKEYYAVGYQTDVEKIDIYQNLVSFYQNGNWSSGTYEYAGYRILTYESGKKGVRYLFTKIEGDKTAPQSIQFSDHIIASEQSAHYHLYFGDQSHEELLKELDNWPTYYPQKLSGEDIAHEMLYH
ncbi:metal-binding protein ZinT [Enterococcus sp. LJL128]|uniref:metal-binding protein ZinT n=1 Tax=Enterococcus sp. LJL51 TaxID=3416656 RepID=UPI003CE99C5D